MAFFKKKRHIKLFSYAYLVQALDSPPQHVSTQLTRLVQKGVLTKIAKGWYENPFNPASPEEIAMRLRYPAYLSMEYLLSKESILSQRTFTLTVMSLKRRYTFTVKDTKLEYHQLSKPLFFGYTTRNGIHIAEPEKALLDLLYIRGTKSTNNGEENVFSLMDDMYLEELHSQKVQTYLTRFPRRVQHLWNKFQTRQMEPKDERETTSK